MPSGRTHDLITCYLTPVMAGCTYLITHQGHLTLLATGAFLFSGLMFGPDLDIHSIQYKRWGWLRWLWLPYRKLLRHRSLLSHGPIIGTLLRLFYLATLFSLFLAVLAAIAKVHFITAVLFGKANFAWFQNPPHAVKQFSQRYLPESLTLLVGLELGAMSHLFSDQISSSLKRLQTTRKQRSRTSNPKQNKRRRKK